MILACLAPVFRQMILARLAPVIRQLMLPVLRQGILPRLPPWKTSGKAEHPQEGLARSLLLAEKKKINFFIIQTSCQPWVVVPISVCLQVSKQRNQLKCRKSLMCAHQFISTSSSSRQRISREALYRSALKIRTTPRRRSAERHYYIDKRSWCVRINSFRDFHRPDSR